MDSKIFKLIILVLAILIFLVVGTNNDRQKLTIINKTEDLTNVLKTKGIVIIDIRTNSEYKESHIPSAINIPYNELKSRLKYSVNTPILVYSKNDSRSHLAALQLKKMNYKTIYELGDMQKYDGKLSKS